MVLLILDPRSDSLGRQHDETLRDEIQSRLRAHEVEMGQISELEHRQGDM